MAQLTTEQKAFAEKLFELYPDFRPTQSLYLDFEGGGNGYESIISLYWPQNRGDEKRFTWKIRDKSGTLAWNDIRDAIEKLGLNSSEVDSIVVYSRGQENPDERERLVKLLGRDPWPKATWVNLLYVTQKSKGMREAIKRHKYVVHETDKTQVRRSLEALEWEFGIRRPPSIRSRKNRYKDGQDGEMSPLKIADKIIKGTATEEERLNLEKYCLQDVKSMFQISRKCERG